MARGSAERPVRRTFQISAQQHILVVTVRMQGWVQGLLRYYQAFCLLPFPGRSARSAGEDAVKNLTSVVFCFRSWLVETSLRYARVLLCHWTHQSSSPCHKCCARRVSVRHGTVALELQQKERPLESSWFGSLSAVAYRGLAFCTVRCPGPLYPSTEYHVTAPPAPVVRAALLPLSTNTRYRLT